MLGRDVLSLVSLASMAACGAAAPATASPTRAATAVASMTAAPTPKPSQTYLVVVGQSTTSPHGQDVLTILDASGVKHASVTFAPPAAPPRRGAIASAQQPATAAAGKAFYLDSTGTVHAIAPDGAPADVAHFPVAADQEVSFAVSPDGTQVIAVVNSGPAFKQYSVYSAAPDGSARRVHGPAASAGIMRLVTWSAAGPVVITDASEDFQGCESGECQPWGHAALLDPTGGTVGAPIGGTDCMLWDIAGPSALCSTDNSPGGGGAHTDLSIRNLDGSGAKPVLVTSYCSCFFDARLSAGGVVALAALHSPGMVATVIVRPDGTTSTVAVPATTSGFGVLAPYNWWGDHTLVGVSTCASIGCTQQGGDLAAVDTTTVALQPVPLDVTGNPVATLTA